MSRASSAGNGVMKAVEDVCGLYGVPVLRMQSRTFTVQGEGGRPRPFFVGEWTDASGVKHRKGMADLLLQPTINMKLITDIKIECTVVIPLWVECKANSGKMEAEQEAFRDWVESIGAWHLCVTDSCEELMELFEQCGVRKP